MTASNVVSLSPIKAVMPAMAASIAAFSFFQIFQYHAIGIHAALHRVQTSLLPPNQFAVVSTPSGAACLQKTHLTIARHHNIASYRENSVAYIAKYSTISHLIYSKFYSKNSNAMRSRANTRNCRHGPICGNDVRIDAYAQRLTHDYDGTSRFLKRRTRRFVPFLRAPAARKATYPGLSMKPCAAVCWTLPFTRSRTVTPNMTSRKSST